MSDQLPALTNKAIPALTDLLYLVEPGIEPLGSFNILISQIRSFLLSGVGVSQPIDTVTASSAAGGALTPFRTYNISLPTNGDYFKFFYGGAYAANTNTKRVTLDVGGNSYEDTGLIDVRTLGWIISGVVTRLSDVAVRVLSVFDGGILVINGANAIVATNIGGRMNQRVSPTLAVPDLDTNPLVMQTSGAGTALADVTQLIGMNEVFQF